MQSTIKFLSLADIPQMVLETSHWNGMIKTIYTKGADVKKVKIDGGTYRQFKELSKRGDDIIEERWRSVEELLNISINGLLMALSSKAQAGIMAGLFPAATVSSSVQLCDIRWDKDISELVGKPDICLASADESIVYLLELKINAKKSNGKYSLQQHIKYTAFKEVLEAEGKEVHVGLLVPESEGERGYLHSRERGWFRCGGRQIVPELSKVDAKPITSIRGVKSYEDYCAHVHKKASEFGFDWSPIREEAFSLISFEELMLQLKKEGAPHLIDVFQTIQRYASGA